MGKISPKKAAAFSLGSLGTGLAAGVLTGRLTSGATKLGLDARDYLKTKRLTNKELKEGLKKLDKSSKEKKPKKEEKS